jgi:lipopolysaccharide transport system permease protein
MNSTEPIETNWLFWNNTQNKFFLFKFKRGLAIPWFVFAFVKRDVVTVYKQTVLGPLWYLIQPLLLTLHYYFNNLAGIDTELFHFV